MTDFEPVIGLEVHCQLAVRSKLFSDAPADHGGDANTRVSIVDIGLPGVLPTLNEQAVEVAVKAALALEGEVQLRTKFDRKNYFYPDLPKGYQISQYDQPFCVGGRIPVDAERFTELERIHLEEDAGKSMHTDDGSLVDLNRVGSALIEIVGRPDLRSAQDAHDCLVNLKQILRYAGVSECDMENGSLRCDANISLRPRGATELGTKVEIKNLNSFKMVQRALDYEIRRQSAALAGGGTIRQETRLWNEERGETAVMRTKESAPDYRYFPDPDLPPLTISPALVTRLQEQLPESPHARRQRIAEEHSLPEHDLDVILADRELADYFEAVAAGTGDAKAASNWTMTEVLRTLHERHLTADACPVAPAQLADLINALGSGRINHPAARRVFAHMLEHGGSAAAAIAALGLQQISDHDALRPIIQRVVEASPKAVADYRAGKEKALHAMKGLVMKETKGKADPAAVDELLRDALSG